MIIRTQGSALVDMAGCIVKRLNQPMPSILLIPVQDLKNGHIDAARIGSVLLYKGTVAEADTKFTELIVAAAAESLYFSMV